MRSLCSGETDMNMLIILAFVALLATVGVMVLGIRSMMHGGEEDNRASTSLMFRRVEFQAAAVGLILAAGLFGSGWLGFDAPSSDRLDVNLGVMAAEVLRDQYAPDSAEARAFGGFPETDDTYLVTVALTDRASGARIDNASVTATVHPLGMGGTTKTLQPATLGKAMTYGNYFRMPRSGMYEIEIMVERPNVRGSDMVRLKYRRPQVASAG